MKHRYTLLLALIISLLFVAQQEAIASHAMGADINYACVDPANNRYYVEFSFYRDCAGATAPFSATIQLSSATCGQNLSITLPKLRPGPPPPGSTDSFEVTPLCQSLIGQSTCNGGSLPGVERHVYADTITLPANCPDWTFSYTLCCRNNQITNLQNASSQSIYVRAQLNNQIGCNSSPRFTSLPVPYICANLPFNYNHGVIEPDGDSLAFSLISPLTTNGTPIAHVPPFSPTQPINTTGPFNFNQNNGQMSFTANGTQVAVVTILVEEFRNGVLIGSTMRDVQIVVVNVPGCVNSAIRFRGIDSATVQGAIFIDTTRVEVCPGDTMEFTFMAYNIAGDTISMFTNIQAAIPGAFIDTIQTAVDTIYGRFRWVPTALDTGLNFFIASFNSCPIASSQAYAMEIFVLPGTEAGGDRYYCPAGGPIRLRAVGGSQFQWSPGFGLSDSTIRNPLASPGVTTTYIVSSNLLSGCKNNDTLTVFAVPDFSYNLTLSDDTVCKFDSVQIQTNADPNFAAYTYDWFQDQWLNANNIGNPYGNPERTISWAVEMISDSGCRITDSIQIVVAGDRPQIEFDGYTTVCDGDSATITAVACLSPALFDDFDPGITGSLWGSLTSNVSPSNTCGSVSGNNALLFDGPTGRSITTVPLDVSNGGTISFWLKEGTGSFGNCDPPALGDDIVLEYSINGGLAWTQIGANYAPGGFTSWTFVEEQIPPAAQTTATLFRWSQIGFASLNFDNWAMDDVKIQCCGNNCANYSYSWTPTTNISNPTVADPIFFPGANTTYTVNIRPAGTDCESSAQLAVNVAPDFDWTFSMSKDTICRNEISQFDLNILDTAFGPYTITWTPAQGLSDSSILNPVASPATTTTYVVEMASALGCIQYDTVTLVVAGSAPIVSILGYDSLCQGDSINLTASPCVGIFEETFEPGLDPSLWGNLSTGMLVDVACGFVSSPNVLVFSGGSFGVPRFAETVDLDMSGGGSITFWLKAGDGSGTINCENVDFGEDLFLEYSTNGGVSWNPVNAANPAYLEANFPTFIEVTEVIPPGAQTPNTRFRWIQNQHSGGTIDNWLVDDITIECCGDNCANFTYSWSPVTFIDDFTSPSPNFFPPNDRTYVVTVGLAGTDCSNTDTVDITVGPDFAVGVGTPDPDSICLYGTSQLEVFPELGKGPYSYMWSPTSVSDSTARNPYAQPSVTTTYTVSVTSDAGCRKVADMTVYVDGVAPQVTVLPDDNFICPGDTVNLRGNISTVPCGPNQVPCQGQFGFASVGTPQTTSTTVSPYRGASRHARVQYLIRASELSAAGIQPGTITDIVFDVSQKTSGGPYLDVTLKMGCTNLTELDSYIEGLPTVDFIPQFFTSNGFTNTHNLDQPFDWDGSSNLIIEVCWENPNGQPGGNDIVNAENVGYNATFAGTSFSIPTGCNITNGFTSTLRPNMQFIFCYEPPSNITYYWEPNNLISDPDSLNVFVTPQRTTTYLLYADDGTCLGSGFAVIRIDSSYYLDAGPDTFTCNSEPIQLHAGIVGSAPSNPNCGTNGSILVGAIDTVYVEPAFPFSSGITPFLADNVNFLPQVITDQRIQILYLAQDLINYGLQPGVISELAFDISAKNSTRPFKGFNIRLGCTNATALNGTAWLPTEPVYSADSITTSLGWNNFQLDSTFDWDGTSNIVVEVCWDNIQADFPNGIDNVNAEFVGYVATHTAIGTVGQGCGFGPNANNLFTSRPDIRFTTYPPAPGPVQFVWDLTNTLSDPFIQSPIADPFTPETYVITATFANGCVLQDSVFVDIFQFSSSLTDDLSICEGDTITLVANAGSGATYRWDSVPGMSCLDCPTPRVSPDTITTYYVRMTASNGCWIEDSVTIDPAGLNVSAWFNDTLVDQGDTLMLGANVSSSLPGLTYSWSPSIYLDDSTAATPTAIPIRDVLPYILTVTSGDCSDTTAINVRVNIIASPFNMPNAFTPNGDGLNDVFYPLTGGLAEVTSFRIYNRWGELLHDDATTGWDGSYKGKIQPSDTYVFYVVISVPFQDDQYVRGTIELIR